MPTTDDDRVVVDLDQAECQELLAGATVGRLGFTDGAMPAIEPVSFAVHDADVVIPARLGSALVSAVRGSIVAFQIDSFRDDTRTGWTVTLVGPTRVVSAPDAVAELDDLWPYERETGKGHCYLAVEPGLFRGVRTYPRSPSHAASGGAAATA